MEGACVEDTNGALQSELPPLSLETTWSMVPWERNNLKLTSILSRSSLVRSRRLSVKVPQGSPKHAWAERGRDDPGCFRRLLLRSVLDHTVEGPNDEREEDKGGADEEENGGTRSEQVFASKTDGVSPRLHALASVHVEEPVGSVRVEVERRRRVVELRSELGGRSVDVVGVEQAQPLVVGVRPLDERDVADEGRPGSSTRDGVDKERPVDGDLREGRDELDVPDDVAEPRGDCGQERDRQSNLWTRTRLES